jgi:hypothetical protein
MPEIDPNRTPGPVIGAVAAGTVVVPFLVVYSFLFITRGIFVQVEQPDITSSRTGEAIAGFVAVVFLALIVIGMGRLLNGHDRWLFLLGQLITFGVCLDFLIDSSKGAPEVPAVVLLGSLIAIVLAVVPASWQWVQAAEGPSDRADADISGIDHVLKSDQG